MSANAAFFRVRRSNPTDSQETHVQGSYCQVLQMGPASPCMLRSGEYPPQASLRQIGARQEAVGMERSSYVFLHAFSQGDPSPAPTTSTKQLNLFNT
jgi:hypothetical protein